MDKHNLLKGKVESNCWCHFTAKVKLDTEIMYMHKIMCKAHIIKF